MAQTARRTTRTNPRAAARARRAADGAARQSETAAAISRPVVEALVEVGRQFFACANRLGTETAGLASRRWRRDLAFAQSLARCRTWSDALSLQRNWAQQAVSDYAENAAAITRLTASAALDSWQPILRAAEPRPT